MLPVSTTFLAAVRESHSIVSRARIVTPGATGADPDGVDIALLGGTVTLDATADVRGTLDLTVGERWPSTATTADLVPYGTEIAISRGVLFGNGSIERAPLGIYRIVSVEQDDAPDGPLHITALDRMSGIIDARLLAPAQYLASNTYGEVVSDLVTGVYPDAVIEWDDATSSSTIGRAVVAEEDRYAFLKELVTSVGKVMFYDYRGVLVIKTAPDPTVAVWEASSGAGGVLASAARTLSRESVYNAVKATGEALDDTPPPVGYAYDTDPTSLTYYLGAFGQVPRFYNSPLLTSNSQAAAAAASVLATSRGLPYAVDFSAVPNPAIEPYDAVQLTYPPDRTRTPHQRVEVHVIDQVNIPLAAADAMTAKTRLTTVEGVFE